METKAPIEIAELEQIAKDKDLQAIVVLTVERNGNVSLVTYGDTLKKCRVIGKWADGLWGMAVSAVPFQTVFGWGYNGVPTPISDVQLQQSGIPREAIKAAEVLFEGKEDDRGDSEDNPVGRG